jgi:hypothetical protein
VLLHPLSFRASDEKLVSKCRVARCGRQSVTVASPIEPFLELRWASRESVRPLHGSHDPHLLQLESQVTRNTDPNPPSPIFFALPIWLGKQELNIEGETNLRTRIEAPIEKLEISVKKGIAVRRSVSDNFSRNSLTLNNMLICFSCLQL